MDHLVPLQVRLISESLVAVLACKCRLVIVDIVRVSLEVPLTREFLVANQTFECLISAADNLVLPQRCLVPEYLVANLTFEWLV